MEVCLLTEQMRPKPAGIAESGGSRGIRITNWRPYQKNSLKGFFDASLPSGLQFHELMLHERNGSRWVAFPAREWKNGAGERQYARFVDFRDRESQDRFRDAVLTALDQHIAASDLGDVL
jgi:hypothetical protein